MRTTILDAANIASKSFIKNWQGELEGGFKRLHHSDSFAKLNLLLSLKSLKNPTSYFSRQTLVYKLKREKNLFQTFRILNEVSCTHLQQITFILSFSENFSLKKIEE